MNQRLGRWRVRILNDQHERGGCFGHTAPLQRWRNAFAIRGVALGNGRVVCERKARHLELRHAAAQIDPVEENLLQAGTLSLQHVAEGIR